jgi:protein regulator of cytokinesis 1
MDTSYLSQQVTTIIERLHGFFDEIGVPSHERDSRESEVSCARAPKPMVGTLPQNKNSHIMIITAILRPLRNPSQPAQHRRQRET